MVVTPYFPVAVGEDVTLKCLTKTPSNRNAHFYKNGLLINPEPTRQLTIRRISKSDEGLYKCNISDLESPPSRLSVSDHSESGLGFLWGVTVAALDESFILGLGVIASPPPSFSYHKKDPKIFGLFQLQESVG